MDHPKDKYIQGCSNKILVVTNICTKHIIIYLIIKSLMIKINPIQKKFNIYKF